jgi:hypothetical protein
MNSVLLMESPITVEDAKHLMEVLENDIPYWENREKIALLLLILAADPSLAKDNDIVTDKWKCRERQSDYGYYSDYG